MESQVPDTRSRKRNVTLTVREDLLLAAKQLKLNASQAAESGIRAAVKAAREERWREQSQAAIRAYNERIEAYGPLLTPLWDAE
jgi:antitoxin CcdA